MNLGFAQVAASRVHGRTRQAELSLDGELRPVASRIEQVVANP